MTAPLAAHPDRSSLERLSRGELPADEAERVRQHAAGCSECSRALFQVATGAGEEGTGTTALVPPPGAEQLAALQPEAKDALAQLPRGSSIGRYVVLDRVGSGGMGVVYAAYDPELDRKVAIKLLQSRSGGTSATSPSSTTGGQQLLLREAQAMARLAHPNVLAVHDVGIWSERVFVAMELVEGKSLRQRIKAGPLPWPQALRILEAAGEGLAEAHAKGLIHRDFKSDNILVGDGGRVQVMDFGLARAAHDPAPSRAAGETDSRGAWPSPSSSSVLQSQLTEAGFVHGTPAYMAPEVIARGAADERSDQFSFGVTLYEALYSERPFGSDRPADPEQWKVKDPPAGSPVPVWLRKVALRCVELKPEARFGSMREVLAALGADPLRGRRRALWAAGVAVAVLASAGAAYGVAARRLRACAGMEQHLAGVWDDAQREAVKAAFAGVPKPFAADAARTASQQLDAYAGAWAQMRQQACEATRLRREVPEPVLALRLSCLDRRLESLSALVSVLKVADAQVAQKAVDAVAGLPALDGCADMAALTALVPPPQDAAARAKVEALRKKLAAPKAQLLAARFKQGLEPAKAAAAEAASLGYAPVVADAQELLGRLEEGAGDFKGAERSFTAAALAAQEGRDDEVGARAWSWLAAVAGLRQARWEAAHDALAMGKATLARLGGRETLAAELRLTEGRLLLAEGKWPDALAVVKEVVDLDRRVLGEDRVETATAEYFLGQCYFRMGKFDQAIEADQKALELRRRVLGPDHPETANAVHLLGTLYQASGKFEEALPLHLQALSIRERALGPEHPDLAYSLNNLTALFATQRKFKEALPYAERTLKVMTAAYGEENPLTATAVHNLGALHGDMKDYPAALELLQRAEKLRVKVLGPEHPDVAATLATESSVLVELGRAKEGLEAAQRALAIREKVLPAGHRDIAWAEAAVAIADLKVGRGADALSMAEKALKIREESKGIPPVELADVRFLTARALWDAGRDKARARELVKAASATYSELKNADRLQEIEKWKSAHSI